jgi:hypothetical protein
VHGSGDDGFVPFLIEIARTNGVSGYIDDGTTRWPAVHRLDAARLFRLALEKAPAGTVLHAVADEGVQTREIAEVIGRRLDLPVVPIDRKAAAGHFGWLAAFFGLDVPASSALTREQTGWNPTQPRLIADLAEGQYFRVPKTAAALIEASRVVGHRPQRDKLPSGSSRTPTSPTERATGRAGRGRQRAASPVGRVGDLAKAGTAGAPDSSQRRP